MNGLNKVDLSKECGDVVITFSYGSRSGKILGLHYFFVLEDTLQKIDLVYNV